MIRLIIEVVERIAAFCCLFSTWNCQYFSLMNPFIPLIVWVGTTPVADMTMGAIWTAFRFHCARIASFSSMYFSYFSFNVFCTLFVFTTVISMNLVFLCHLSTTVMSGRLWCTVLWVRSVRSQYIMCSSFSSILSGSCSKYLNTFLCYFVLFG